jgi:hypothetical protein
MSRERDVAGGCQCTSAQVARFTHRNASAASLLSSPSTLIARECTAALELVNHAFHPSWSLATSNHAHSSARNLGRSVRRREDKEGVVYSDNRGTLSFCPSVPPLPPRVFEPPSRTVRDHIGVLIMSLMPPVPRSSASPPNPPVSRHLPPLPPSPVPPPPVIPQR